MFTAQDQETRSTVSARPAWNLRQHRTFLAAEGVLLALMVTLAVLARLHPGPFPGDLGLSLAWERLVRPDGTATAIVEFFGNATWPLQAMLIAIGIAIVFALFRRWLDIIISLATAALASGTNLTIMQLVGRPRPAGPGLHVNGNVGFPSFPSGHVEHALAFYGIVLFLTFQMRYPHWWLWIVRVPLIVFIVMLAPSRLVTGEHWPSDVLAALIWGAIWLLLAIQVYRWAAQRWPRLVPDNERNAQGHDDTPITHAGRRPTLHARPSGRSPHSSR